MVKSVEDIPKQLLIHKRFFSIHSSNIAMEAHEVAPLKFGGMTCAVLHQSVSGYGGANSLKCNANTNSSKTAVTAGNQEVATTSLFGFNVAFRHLRSYHDSACLQQWYFDQYAATQECHAQTYDMTPHPVTVYRHGADLSLCYSLMWNITLEYTTTKLNVLGQTRSGNHSPTFHTHQRTLNVMMQ